MFHNADLCTRYNGMPIGTVSFGKSSRSHRRQAIWTVSRTDPNSDATDVSKGLSCMRLPNKVVTSSR
jgi:hypothetical protein